MFSSHFQHQGQSPASNLSPGGFKDDEPRKRAPRALTGRYVRTGTAASPRVLQILRKKVEDRLKLKELLGENSHLYFAGANKQQPQYKPLNQKIKKKFWKLCSVTLFLKYSICELKRFFLMLVKIPPIHCTKAEAQCFNSKYFILSRS